MLIGVQDIRAMPIEQLRQRGDNAPPVGAGDKQSSNLFGDGWP
jgi:hypothetical protein